MKSLNTYAELNIKIICSRLLYKEEVPCALKTQMGLKKRSNALFKFSEVTQTELLYSPELINA